MIQGINNQNYTDPYRSQNQSRLKVSGEDAPEFLLGNEKEGVVWERQEEKKEKKTGKEAAKKSLDQQSSGAGSFQEKYPDLFQEQGKKEKAQSSGESGKQFQIFADKLIGFVRKLFRQITKIFWYGDEGNQGADGADAASGDETGKASQEQPDVTEFQTPDTEKAETGTAEGTDAASEAEAGPAEKDAKIRKLLEKKDTQAVMDILTDHNTRRLAKKTGLLTQYDRHGEIKMPDGSDQSRILGGDKTLKM